MRFRGTVRASAAVLLAVAVFAPAAGAHGHGSRRAAAFRVGAAVADFTPPLAGHAPGGDPADCDPTGRFSGPRQYAFEEPYIDLQHSGHYDLGDPYLDCNHNGRWDGNLLGGGGATPRFYDHVADPVGARAIVVGNGRSRIAVEVTDQEGLFSVYQQQIRDRVAADGYHLDGIFISATHDESAPDSLGLGGVMPTISGVNDYWVQYMVRRSALAIERAARAMRPARIRLADIREPANLRQCWSSYPYVDNQVMPVLQAVDRRGRTIATLADVSQHAETLGFNGGTPTLDAQNRWISSDWVHFLRTTLERRLGGVGIEMAGTVGSVESPEVYPRAISRVPAHYIDASHPAGCRTLFSTRGGDDPAGSSHVPLGYLGETRAWGQAMGSAIAARLHAGRWGWSRTSMIWGGRSPVCVPLDNALFRLAAGLGVFAHRPGYNADCSMASPVAPNGSSAGQAILSEVAAFRIGDASFVSIPGEVFPFTFLRSFLGPQDLPVPGLAMPPWLIPHMHTPYRFIDGLAEDMIGYIFPQGNAVGIPTVADPNPSGTDRFGCGHSDDAEAVSPRAADLIGGALVRLLDARGGRPERIVRGRYILPNGTLSRDPQGGPEVKCNLDMTFHFAGEARAVRLADGRTVRPRRWMSLLGTPQRVPDRDTRGYFDRRGLRVWLDVYT